MANQQPLDVFNDLVIENGDLSGNITSSVKEIKSIRSFAVQFYWSGASSPVGEVYIEGSNDNENFTQIVDSLLPVSGNDGSCLINVELPAYAYVRVQYDRTSGSGNASCRIHGKQ